MRRHTLPACVLALGLGLALWFSVSPVTAQAPPPGYRSAPPPPPPTTPGPAGALSPAGAPADAGAMPPAPTQMQSTLDAPGRVVVLDEYRVGETTLPGAAGPVATIGEGGAPAAPARVRFSAAVVYERGREDQRVKGLKITIERPMPDGTVDEIACYVDRTEMQPLAVALQQMADQAGGRGGYRDADQFSRRRPRDRATGRFVSFATSDFAVSTRFEPGRPVIFVRNPNHPGTRLSLGDESTVGVLDQWSQWIAAAHQVLERK